MAKNELTLSPAGQAALVSHEAFINGLYDDSSGFATYGVGHLVQKFPSVLLATAKAEGLCQSRVKKKNPHTKYETTYLEREALACEDFETLKKKAVERAPEIAASAMYKKPLADLTEKQQASARAAAKTAVAEEARLLNVPVADVLKSDAPRYERPVNKKVTGVALKQDEFDALVSFVFNAGETNFADSTLLKRINENRFRTGDIRQREEAIAAIDQEFGRWVKSGGKTVAGLVKRRKAEANLFLKAARAELAAMKAKTMGPPRPPSPQRQQQAPTVMWKPL